jgi:hypothetical protein
VFEFIFGMVVAMAVTILAITTWAAPRILTTIRLRRSRRFTGLTTGICTEGNRFNRAEQRFGKKGMVDMTGISGRLPGDAIEHGAL